MDFESIDLPKYNVKKLEKAAAGAAFLRFLPKIIASFSSLGPKVIEERRVIML